MPSKNSSPAGPRVSDIVGAIESIAPAALAESWDNVGLQLGSPDAPAGRIMVALETTPRIIEECRTRRVGTLVTHHPLLFRPTKNLVENNPVNRMAAELVRRGINLIVAHTNLDSISGGTNGEFADRLGLEARRFLKPASMQPQKVKYVVFVPESHVAAVIDAAAGAGAGRIGNYEKCSFRARGTGTYVPGEAAKPFAGKRGELEQAEELRLEMECPRAVLPKLIEAVRKVHPYEEVAYDIYPIESTGGPRYGLGIVGDLPKHGTLAKLAALCKERIGSRTVGLVGDSAMPVRRVAICTGAAGEIVQSWRPGTADALVTGELNHHQCAEARDRGIGVVLVGHHESEVIVAGRLVADLLAMPTLRKLKADIFASECEESPLRWA